MEKKKFAFWIVSDVDPNVYEVFWWEKSFIVQMIFSYQKWSL